MIEPNDGYTADAKSGWLYNQERVLCCLKQWKRRWFVLDRDCHLRYFRRPQNPVASRVIVLRKQYTILDSDQMERIDLPRGCSQECLLKIETGDCKLTLCSDTPDEMRAWRNILESIRGICTAPLAELRELQVLTPVVFLQATTTPTYVVQNADVTQTTTTTTTTIISQATPSHVGYHSLAAAPVVATRIIV